MGDLGSILQLTHMNLTRTHSTHKLFQFTEDLGVQLVIVNIADENDNGPLFTEKLYTGGNLFFLFTAKFALNLLLTLRQIPPFHGKKPLAPLRRPALLTVHFDLKPQLIEIALIIFKFWYDNCFR